MKNQNNTPCIGDIIKIPVTETQFGVCYVAYVGKSNISIYILGFEKLFTNDSPIDQIQSYIASHDPTLAISTTDALISINLWSVIGSTSRDDHWKFFPAYRRRRHPQKDWVVDDYTRSFSRTATENDLSSLKLRTDFSPAVMTRAIKVSNNLENPTPHYGKCLINQQQLAKDYFEDYAPPLAQ